MFYIVLCYVEQVPPSHHRWSAEMTAVKTAEGIRRDIETALREGMENVITVCLGENLNSKFTYEELPRVQEGVAFWQVTAKVAYLGRTFSVTAEVPIRFPDGAVNTTRIDDRIFVVHIDDYAAAFSYEAWCTYHLARIGDAVIVRETFTQQCTDRWLVGSSEPGVLYRGGFEEMAPWAKKIAARRWPQLSYAVLDSEQAAARHVQ